MAKARRWRSGLPWGKSESCETFGAVNNIALPFGQVATQIGGDDMIPIAQLFGDPVPVAAMVPAAMDEQ